MSIKNQNIKIKYLIINNPQVFLVTLSFLYLLPLLSSYLIPDDIKFAFMFGDYGFFESLRNIWLSSIEVYNKDYFLRPITHSISLIEYSIWGIKPFWHHLTNVSIHVINIILIYQFSFILLKRRELSLICAIIFTIHPIMINATFWMNGKADIVACSFYLLSLITLCRYIEKNHLRYLIISQILFLVALLSKETSITLFLAQYWLVFWKKDELVGKEEIRALLLKIFCGNLFTILIFLSFLSTRFNQNLFFIINFYKNYNFGDFFEFLISLKNSGSFILLPFGYSWFETFFLENKFYMIVLLMPVFIKSLFFIYSNNNKYYKYIMSFMLFLIHVFYVSNSGMIEYLYLPICFFAIFLGQIIYDSYQKSKIIFIVLTLYGMTLLIGSLINYGAWVDINRINRALVNGLEEEMNENDNFDAYVILNFPSKVNQDVIFKDEFESFVNLKTSLDRKIIMPVFVVHDRDIKPTAIYSSDKSITLNACEQSSYFLVGEKPLVPGQVLNVKNGKIIIQKVNQKGNAIRIVLKLKNNLLESRIRCLYFDESSLQYEVFTFK